MCRLFIAALRAAAAAPVAVAATVAAAAAVYIDVASATWSEGVRRSSAASFCTDCKLEAELFCWRFKHLTKQSLNTSIQNNVE